MRFVPVIILAYFVAYIDRVNLGMVKSDMAPEIGLTDVGFGLASGLIYVGLIFFEVPSNLFALKFGSRRWITRIMVSWGVIVMACALIQNSDQLYIMRLLLGLGEAGMAPAFFLYLAQWFPARHRGRTLSAFYLSVPLAMALGSPLTGWLLESFHELLGISGWRWVFLLEGMAAIAVAPLIFYRLADRPRDAKFLNVSEQQWLENELSRESHEAEKHNSRSFLGSLTDKRVLLFAVTYMLLGYGTNGLAYWMPSVVKNATHNLTSLQIGLVSAIPFVSATIGILATGRIAERTGAKLWNILIPLVISVVGFTAAVLTHSIVLTVGAICIALTGALAAQPQFWTLPTAYLTGASAAGGLAMINSVSNIGGFAGPFSFGWLKALGGGSVTYPFIASLVAQALAAAGIIIAHRTRPERKAHRATTAPQPSTNAPTATPI
ncbi:MFS transporter [Nocardia tengchongensis]